MDWRVAASLDVLLDEVNAKAPQRSKASDGSIGDEAHSSRESQHNPDSNGVVRARDITDDPLHGHNATVFAEWLRQLRDPRILYVIDDQGDGVGNMFSSYSTSTRKAWEWGPYSGYSHAPHTHISVVADPRLYDSTAPWGWAAKQEDTMFVDKGDSGAQVRYWQRLLNRAVGESARIVPDGDYGDSTKTLVAEVTNTDGKRIGPREADRIHAAVTTRLIRRALKSVPMAQVDVEALAREVAEDLTVRVVPKP